MAKIRRYCARRKLASLTDFPLFAWAEQRPARPPFDFPERWVKRHCPGLSDSHVRWIVEHAGLGARHDY